MNNQEHGNNIAKDVQEHKKPVLIFVSIMAVLLMIFFAVYFSGPSNNINFSYDDKKVNQQYYHALHNANQGKVDVAVKQLKEIIKENPKYEPAKKLYQSLIARDAPA